MRQRTAWDLYNNKPRPALRHRANLIVPVMGGFVDTLKDKIHNPPDLKFGYTDPADMLRAEKVQAAYKQFSSHTHDNWGLKNHAASTSAIFSARAIFKYVPSKTKPTLSVIDPLSFLGEPFGGGRLEKHVCKGEKNIYLEKWQIEAGATDGTYDKKQVGKLLNGYVQGMADDKAGTDDARTEKERRLRLMGLNPMSRQYLGDPVYQFVEWYTHYQGTYYCILIDMASHLWIKCKTVKELYGTEDDPYVSWTPFYDEWNFWPKAPVDDMVYICEGIQLSINQLFDSVNEMLWPQLLVDPIHILDQQQLAWEPRGIIEVDRKGLNMPVDDFVKTFSPSSDKNAPMVSMNLVKFLQNMGGQMTGVTADAQGASDEKQVGITVANLQQVADRMRMYDDLRKWCWASIGQKFVSGLDRFTPTDWMVKVEGLKGVGWQRAKLTKGDVRPVGDFDITVSGGDTEAKIDELKRRAQSEDLNGLVANPLLLQEMNPKAVVETVLSRNLDSDQVKKLMDTDEFGSSQVFARAENYIQDILAGKRPPLEFAATDVFISHISDWALENKNDMDDKDFKAIMDYALAHKGIAIRNAMQKARADFQNDMRQGVQGGALPPPGGQAPPMGSPVNPQSAGLSPQPASALSHAMGT